jgi:hypothetical protein
MPNSGRPTAIHVENCENVTLENNKGYGDMNLIVAKNSKDIKGSGNELFTEHNHTESDKSWMKPLMITIFAGLIVAAITVFIFEPWQHDDNSKIQMPVKSTK